MDKEHRFSSKMTRTIRYIFVLLLILPLTTQAQLQKIQDNLANGKYEEAYNQINETYSGDTLNKDRLHSLYVYYLAPNNTKSDSMQAFIYAKLYNEQVKDKKINLDGFAKSLLMSVYKSKDLEQLNKYIEYTNDYPALNKEAQRIRNQIAYENAQTINTAAAYKEFIELYPDAMQAEDATLLLNEKLMQELLKSGDIESLKSFANTTTSDKYKSQALKEIDRLSFNRALKTNTLESYDKYIKEFPEGEYIIMAKSKRDLAQYDRYVNEGDITDMIYYLRTTSSKDKNYDIILDKLKIKTIKHYSLNAMAVIDSLTNDTVFLERFAKRYVADYSLASIERLLKAFPKLTNESYILEAEQKAKQIATLSSARELTLDDYKKNKNLFTNLNAREVAKLFYHFDALNSVQPKTKMLKFNLGTDIHYLNYLYAKNLEMDFVLTDDNYDAQAEDRPNMKTLGLDVETTDAYYVTDSLILFSATTMDGYDIYDSCKNKDIYYAIYEDDKWQKPQVLCSQINTRFDESNPVLSSDGKTLWFSSDRDLNFGGKDIYVSYRTNINDWDSWSTPMLLGEDFNTKDNDYVLHVTDNLIVLSQDETMSKENNIYLEGKTALNFVSGRVNSTTATSLENTKVKILNKKDMSLLNTTTANEKGCFAFLAPKTNYVLSSQKTGYYSPLSEDSIINMYYIEDIVSKQTLLTITSPFDTKNPLELSKQGQNELISLANAFKKSPYMLTIEVHALTDYKKQSALELSETQASAIKTFLVKQGMLEDALIINGLGKSKIVQGWETTPSIDISLINR